MSVEAAVDLRSDTFTVPDAAMRSAMASAEVGDDDWGEDPTVRRLEERVSALLGTEAALLVPSGTMANLCAILAQTAPGDGVVTDTQSHLTVYEGAGVAALTGVRLHHLDCEGGAPSAGEVDAALATAAAHHASVRLLALENTHMLRGGVAVSRAAIDRAASAAHAAGLRVHCDGARLFNAAAALDVDPGALVSECDTVTVAFSKGLGAPVGSALAGDAVVVAEARRWRKRLGGGMRQAGVLAAAALHGLEHNRARLADDHASAAVLRLGLRRLPGVEVVEVPTPTNVVLLRTRATAEAFTAAAAAEGVLVTVMDRHVVRCMTYLGVDAVTCRHAVVALRTVAERLATQG